MSDKQVVIKLGGSLLERPDVVIKLRDWLARRSQAERRVFVVGGGRRVDLLREQHARQAIAEEAAHWAAIEVMDSHAAMVADWLGLAVTTRPDDLRPALALMPSRFLHEIEPGLPGERLPIGWNVTSDSIAARVASIVDAQLLLLKPTPPPAAIADNIAALAECGYVDGHFPRASFDLRKVEFQTLEQ